jgi:hypothetical protein
MKVALFKFTLAPFLRQIAVLFVASQRKSAQRAKPPPRRAFFKNLST